MHEHGITEDSQLFTMPGIAGYLEKVEAAIEATSEIKSRMLNVLGKMKEHELDIIRKLIASCDDIIDGQEEIDEIKMLEILEKMPKARRGRLQSAQNHIGSIRACEDFLKEPDPKHPTGF